MAKNSPENHSHIAPASPCVEVCAVDAAGYCRGCFRTLEEISAWPALTPVEQWALVDLLAARRRAHGGAD